MQMAMVEMPNDLFTGEQKYHPSYFYLITKSINQIWCLPILAKVGQTKYAKIQIVNIFPQFIFASNNDKRKSAID